MGLFRTAARAGVAARVVGNVQRRQQQDWAAQDAAARAAAGQPPAQGTQPAPEGAQPAPTGLDQRQALIDQLAQLGQLRASGVLTEAEFEAQKQQLLAGR